MLIHVYLASLVAVAPLAMRMFGCSFERGRKVVVSQAGGSSEDTKKTSPAPAPPSADSRPAKTSGATSSAETQKQQDDASQVSNQDTNGPHPASTGTRGGSPGVDD